MSRATVRPGEARGRLRAPGSKSHTHRALVAAASLGLSLTLRDPLDSDDTRLTAEGLRSLGYPIALGSGAWRVGPRTARDLPRRTVRIECGASGTSLRFLAPLAARESVPVRFTGDAGLARRPHGDLAPPLRALGARVARTARTALLEVEGPIRPGRASVETGRSSQPLSGLLLALAGFEVPSEIRPTGRAVSRPYTDLTVALLRRLGAPVRRVADGYRVGGPVRRPAPRSWPVPIDASSAAYLWAAAAASGGDVTVLGALDLRSPDLRILPWLRAGGVDLRIGDRAVRASGRLRRAPSVDLRDAPDLAPLVAVLAAGVGGRCTIRGAPHLPSKESDRRAGAARLAEAIGARVRLRPDGLEIEGTEEPRPLDLGDLDDHRMLLSAAVGALAARSPSRLGPSDAVRKSYPSFWRDLGALGIRVGGSGS